MAQTRILLVEDDPAAAAEVAALLSAEGWDVTLRSDGETGLETAAREPFDLIVADRRMPRRDGVSMIARLREIGVATPALILSAFGETRHRVDGLEAGADDYLPKPFEGAELTARVRAQLRRKARSERAIALGRLTIFLDSAAARFDSEPLDLTAQEFAFLRLLAEAHPGAATRRMILRDVMGWTAEGEPAAEVIAVAVHRLREKLRRAGAEGAVETVKRVGYRLAPAALGLG